MGGVVLCHAVLIVQGLALNMIIGTGFVVAVADWMKVELVIIVRTVVAWCLFVLCVHVGRQRCLCSITRSCH